MTGATGLVGRAVTKALTDAGHTVHGVARKKTDWWPRNSPFLELDLLKDNVAALKPAMDGVVYFLHVCDLGKTDIERNKQVAQVCYNLCREMHTGSFLYFSSIRVYGSLLGKVDESTAPRPFASDKYGICKLEIEERLSRLREEGGPALSILRLGNVFSKATPHKFPEMRNAVTRFRCRGMNTHLIGAANVAYAVLNLITGRTELAQGIINVTQELDGENDYFYLAELINGNQKAKPARISAAGRFARAWLANRRGKDQADYFNTILETRLRSMNIAYPETLREQLLSAKRAFAGGERKELA